MSVPIVQLSHVTTEKPDYAAIVKRQPIKHLQPLITSTTPSSIVTPAFVLDDCVSFGESETIEFKESFCVESVDRYRKTINAFLNTNGGKLIFGVKDNGVACGLACAMLKKGPQSQITHQRALDAFKLWVDETQSQWYVPLVFSLTVEAHKLSRDRWIWIVHVPKSNEPIHYQNVIYRRLNASTVVHQTKTIVTENELKTVKDHYETQINGLTHELNRCRMDSKRVDIALNSCATELKELKIAHGQLQVANEQMQAAIQQHGIENHALEAENTKLKTENQEIQLENQFQYAAKEQVQIDTVMLRDDNNKLSTELQQIRRTNELLGIQCYQESQTSSFYRELAINQVQQMARIISNKKPVPACCNRLSIWLMSWF